MTVIEKFDQELVDIKTKVQECLNVRKWLEDCPSQTIFEKEVLELKSRIDALEIDFEEERIKEYLKRVATAASCLEQNQEEPQPEQPKPDNRS